MGETIDHAWTRNAQIRLNEAAIATGGLRVSVENFHAHIWTFDEPALDQILADIAAVKAILAKRKADEPKLGRAA